MTERDESEGGLPRWVKLFLITAAVLAAVLVALMLAGGGQHGPGRHSSSTAHNLRSSMPLATSDAPWR